MVKLMIGKKQKPRPAARGFDKLRNSPERLLELAVEYRAQGISSALWRAVVRGAFYAETGWTTRMRETHEFIVALKAKGFNGLSRFVRCMRSDSVKGDTDNEEA